MLLQIVNFYFFIRGLFSSEMVTSETSTVPVGTGEYKKMVYVLLDGLRIDGSIKTKKTGHYFNNMKFLASVKNKFHSIAVAGTPTSTERRVHGLGTGIPGNFLSTVFPSIEKEDNLVRQVLRKSKNTAYYGDETWTYYFPEVKDIENYLIRPYDKSDGGVKEEIIINKVLDAVGKKDFIISHIIDLDKNGHIYTLNHPQMAMILKKQDEFIKQIYEKMDDDTLLVIVSDHGVTDEGAHGGNLTEELSSVGIFISKKDEPLIKNNSISEVLSETRKKYLLKQYEERDWIESEEPVYLIHQDDVLPTISYLLGMPIPMGSSGNFIHEIVTDEECYKVMARQKAKNLGITYNENNDASVHNYHLTQEMYKKFAGVSIFKQIISAIISIAIILLTLKLIKPQSLKNIENIGIIFIIVMVGHSVFCSFHEELFWMGLFVVFNPTVLNILAFLMLLQIGKPPIRYLNDLSNNLHSLVLPTYFNWNTLYILELMIFIIIKELNIKKIYKDGSILQEIKKIPRVFIKHPQLLISLFNYFSKNEYNTVEFRQNYLPSSLNADTIAALLYRPMESIFLIYILKSLDIKNNILCYYSLLNIAIHGSGLKKLFTSINYDFTWLVTNEFYGPAVLLSFLFYIIYPRYVAHRRFKITRSNNKKIFDSQGKPRNTENINFKEITFFSNVNTLVAMWVGFVIKDQVAFHIHMGIRMFFELIYYIMDLYVLRFLDILLFLINKIFN